LKSKRNKKLFIKISIVVCILLTGVILLTSCVSGMTPVGWSGVAVGSNGTIYMGSKEGRLVSFKPDDMTTIMRAEALKDASAGSGSCLGSTSSTGSCSSGSSSAGGCGGTPAVAIYGTPALSGDLVYIAGYNGKILAYNTSSLQTRWVYPREGYLKPIVSALVISGNFIYFGCSDNNLYALDLTTGDFKWQYATGGEIWASPVVDNGIVFFASFDKKIYALDAVTGSKKWEFTTSATNIATPVALDGAVYVGSLDRTFYCLNQNDGSVLWRYQAENWFWSRPVVYKDIVFAPCMDNRVYGFNAKTGEKVFIYDVEGQVASWPIIVDDRLIVATRNAKLWSLSTDSSKQDKIMVTEIPEDVTCPLSATSSATGPIVYINGPDNNVRMVNLTTRQVAPPISIKTP
jgi:outer membrane protein assembly factor BamB